MFLYNLSWTEIHDYLKNNDMIIIPFGNLECHGPHAPVGSCLMLAQKVAQVVSSKTDIPVFPTFPVGISTPYKNFPGSVNVKSTIFQEFIKDLCKNLINQGFRKIVFLTAHGGGNISALTRVAARKNLRSKY
jgi:creatinine amidohydrolase